MHWKSKLAWALFLVPLVVGVVWSLAAWTPMPFFGALLLVGIVLDGLIRGLMRDGHAEDE
jgi:hypothetical protein